MEKSDDFCVEVKEGVKVGKEFGGFFWGKSDDVLC